MVELKSIQVMVVVLKLVVALKLVVVLKLVADGGGGRASEKWVTK